MINKYKYLVISIVLHSMFFISFGGGNNKSCGLPASGGASKIEQRFDIVDKKQKLAVVSLGDMFTEEQQKVIKDEAKRRVLDEECETFFGGVGISINSESPKGAVQILEVHFGYPAKRAGLQRNDIITSMVEIIGVIGTPVSITYIRNGLTRYVTIIRGKICTKYKKKPKK